MYIQVSLLCLPPTSASGYIEENKRNVRILLVTDVCYKMYVCVGTGVELRRLAMLESSVGD